MKYRTGVNAVKNRTACISPAPHVGHGVKIVGTHHEQR